ncbi:hypothetical protein LUZ62_033849 [Rhynchospora pubera]|uniref:Retrotransposon Copia-like N-terminal domain-containing protein n=1 Tax=Rhynchospora pubera TaxID=906938 RepID=A0AAV8I019_9POAL|nr:hypothetical protein LUZ62_033849 [Rhynchospora pubera]
MAGSNTEKDKDPKIPEHATEGGRSYISDSNTALKLTSVPLNGHIYLSWAKAVNISLGGKGKLGHINGKLPKPLENNPNFDQWQSDDLLVVKWILNSMAPEIENIFLLSADTAFDLWQSVQSMYGQENNHARIYELKQEIAQIKKDNRSNTEYLGLLKTKWQELAFYLPPTTDLKVIQARTEQDCIYQYLSGFDSSYEQIRSQILNSAELPSLATVVATIQREETRQRFMTTDNQPQSENQAFVSHWNKGEQTSKQGEHVSIRQGGRGSSSGRGRGRGRGTRATPYCDYCNKPGHSRDRCWDLFPHLKPRWDRSEERDRPQAQAAVAQPTVTGTSTGTDSGAAQFTLAQLQQILQHLNSSNQSVGNTGQNDREEDW